jgi:Asp-tRNA(Asn)/Glu-tRNA(Gln) amidotransferase A subunit family amidase
MPLSRTLDHVGPLTARSPTPGTCFTPCATGAREATAATPVHALALAMPRRYFCDLLDDDVAAAFEALCDRSRRAGRDNRRRDIPHASLIATSTSTSSFGDAAAYHADTLDIDA